jgi:hypothetical protein
MKTKNGQELLIVNAVISELVGDFFNNLPVQALKNIPVPIATRIGKFMFANGYRLVFDKWYLQDEPLRLQDDGVKE